MTKHLWIGYTGWCLGVHDLGYGSDAMGKACSATMSGGRYSFLKQDHSIKSISLFVSVVIFVHMRVVTITAQDPLCADADSQD